MRVFKVLIWSALVSYQLGNCEPPNPAPATHRSIRNLAEMPISFEPNRGQAPAAERFVSRGLEYSLGLSESGASLTVSTGSALKSLDLRFVNSSGFNSSSWPRMEGTSALPYNSNYFVGNDPHRWLQNVPNFAKVRYTQVWKGIDAVFYGNHSRLEYDLIVAPGANPGKAHISFPGATVRLNDQGDLVLHTAQGDFVQNKPTVYQMAGTERHAVAARYLVAGNRVRFEIGQYDRSRELVIDPQLSYSIGEINAQYISSAGVGVDSSANNYIGGTTFAITAGAGCNPYTNAWLAKLDIQGNILGSTITIGACDGNVTVNGLTADPSGNIYITGSTTSTADLPVPNAFQASSAGGASDAFLYKIATANNTPSLVYGTYFGGTGADSANAISVPTNDLVVIAGQTNSPSIHNPTNSQGFSGGNSDAFVARFNTFVSGASSFVYSMFLGGSGDDYAQGVAADFSGVVYVAGNTTSTNFQPASANGYDTLKTNNAVDGFLVKLVPSGTLATYLTYYPAGPINGVAIDLNANAFTTGTANGSISTNSVIPGYQVSGGSGHAFVAKFNTNVTGVSSLAYATYLLGNGFDTANAVATDGNGKAYVTGSTNSSNFPTFNPIQASLAGNTNAYVTVLDTTKSGSAGLVFSTYLGGSGPDSGQAIAVNKYGNPTIGGQTSSPNFPVTPGKQEGGSAARAFVTKIVLEAPPFGVMDTPPNNSGNLAGAIGVTGWALSGITVANVGIYRDPLPGEGSSLIFIGNATFVPGTRPDVMAAFPGYPNNNSAGWGYQLLTNELPATGGMALGNGSYRLHALATDPEGLSTDIGDASITVNNAGSNLPFGTIDTPGQGATVSGSAYVNFGWALTPQPACIATNGSTITVYIDNLPVGHPTYNQPRSDIQTLFPGYCNTNGAVGFFMIDTTKLPNGLHSIQWVAVDNAGHAAGLGSRYFTVQN